MKFLKCFPITLMFFKLQSHIKSELKEMFSSSELWLNIKFTGAMLLEDTDI